MTIEIVLGAILFFIFIQPIATGPLSDEEISQDVPGPMEDIIDLIDYTDNEVIQPEVPIPITEEDILQNFLADDMTNKRSYTDTYPYFTCGHFTQQLIQNASNEGIKMYPAYLFSKYGIDHIVVGTKINGTWIFIEPMSDKIFNEVELKRSYKGYRIGETISCSDYSRLNYVDGVIEMKMWK